MAKERTIHVEKVMSCMGSPHAYSSVEIVHQTRVSCPVHFKTFRKTSEGEAKQIYIKFMPNKLYTKVATCLPLVYNL